MTSFCGLWIEKEQQQDDPRCCSAAVGTYRGEKEGRSLDRGMQDFPSFLDLGAVLAFHFPALGCEKAWKCLSCDFTCSGMERRRVGSATIVVGRATSLA